MAEIRSKQIRCLLIGWSRENKGWAKSFSPLTSWLGVWARAPPCAESPPSPGSCWWSGTWSVDRGKPERGGIVSIRENILIVKQFMYRFLVNVPSQICRREGRFRAAIQIETFPQAVSEVKLVNSLRPDHLIINSNSNCLRTNTFGSSERDPGSPPWWRHLMKMKIEGIFWIMDLSPTQYLSTCSSARRRGWARSGGRPRPRGRRTRCRWRTSAPPHWPRTGSGPCWPGSAGRASRSSCSTWRAPHLYPASCAPWWDSPCREGSWN